MRKAAILVLFVALLATQSVLLGQVASGTINVQVQDSSGALVPGASVTLKHTSTGQVRQGTTNERGEFLASFMPIGLYTLTAGAPGFKTKTTAGLELLVDQHATIPVTLEPGEVREVVEVTAVTPLLEASSASLGQVIANRKILELPLNGRNPFALGLLAGNTTPVLGMGTNLPFIAGGGRFSSNDVMIDGVDNNTTVNNGSVGRAGLAYQPSVDAVQEFKVKTNAFSAEFGHSAGTVINATIKSGSNSLHGTLFEFLRNDKLDANNFFTNAAGRAKAKFRQNQFGAAAGGRIIPNRTFFFMDYQGTRQRTAATSAISSVVPTAFRSGDFSQLGATIFDPGARRIGPTGTVISTPFPNNQIPASKINPTSAAIEALVPAPNYGPAGALSRNFFLQQPQQWNDNRGDARIDHNLSNRNTLFGRFSYGGVEQPTPGAFPGFVGGSTTTSIATRNFVLADTHIFSPAMVNEFRFGYNRNNSGTLADEIPQGVDFANKNHLALFPFPLQGFPTISFRYSGVPDSTAMFTQYGGATSNVNIENHFQWLDNLNITRGAHTLKMGGDVRRLRYENLKGTPFFGDMIFGSIFTSSSDTPGSGNPYADYLLGYPAALNGGQMLDYGRQREIYFGGYFQDDWKVTRKLSLNLGIRYELFTQPVDARDRGGLFNVSTGQWVVPGKNGFTRAIVDGDHNNIGPRVGLAYQAHPKMVIRGAYGIFYGARDANQGTTQFAGNPPNVPMISAPSITASGTVAPPYTMNTPIVAVPTDITLASFSAANPTASIIRDEDFHASNFPMLHQFNASLQYEPFQTWLFEVSLSGARGRDLASLNMNQNQLPFQAALDGHIAQTDRKFPKVNAPVYIGRSFATSDYNAVNFKLEKRYSVGLNLLANYTIQKNIESNGAGPCAYSQSAGSSVALDPYNMWRERSVAPIDVPQVLIVNYGYELPWGPGKRWLSGRGAVPRILGGWQVNGITSLRAGFPSDIGTNVLPPLYGFFNVPDRVVGQSVQVQNGRGVDGFFNPNAFTVPGTTLSSTGTPVQLYGNSGRYVLRGPGSVNFDFSAFKEAMFTERYRLQFRTEFFNLTNTPTFYLPAASNLALTCVGPPGAACNKGNPQFGMLSNGTATGRQIQFGLKFLF